MTLLADLGADAGLAAVFLVLLVLLLALCEAGYRLGRARARRSGVGAQDNAGISTLMSGMLGLLAFALGLTVSLADTRFEARRALVVQEANAVGTAWLRARMIGAPEGTDIAARIETYAQARLDFLTRPAGSPLDGLNAATSAQQTQIWATATRLAQSAPTPITAALVTALNDMFDTALAQRFAYASRVPVVLAWALLAGSAICVAAVGFQLGLAGRRQMVLSTALLVMWSGGMLLNLDLNEPRLGGIRVNPAPMQWTIQGFKTTPPM